MRPFLFFLRQPRNPLAKFVFGLMGFVFVGVTLLVGFVAGAALLLGLGGRKLFGRFGTTQRQPHPQQPSDPDVIEGEFSVVEKPQQTIKSH